MLPTRADSTTASRICSHDLILAFFLSKFGLCDLRGFGLPKNPVPEGIAGDGPGEGIAGHWTK